LQADLLQVPYWATLSLSAACQGIGLTIKSQRVRRPEHDRCLTDLSPVDSHKHPLLIPSRPEYLPFVREAPGALKSDSEPLPLVSWGAAPGDLLWHQPEGDHEGLLQRMLP